MPPPRALPYSVAAAAALLCCGLPYGALAHDGYHHMPNTSAPWQRANIALNSGGYAHDGFEGLDTSVEWHVQVKTVLGFILCPIAAALAHRGEAGCKANLWALGTLLTTAYSLLVGGGKLGELNLWREAHLAPHYEASFRFDTWTTTTGWVALLALCGMLAPTMGRLPAGGNGGSNGNRAVRWQRRAGNLASVVLIFHWYFSLCHVFGFGLDLSRCTKEVFGHLVIGVFFIAYGSSVLGYGEDALIVASPVWKIDHRVILVLGLIYGYRLPSLSI
eukprot:COSAG05_NODE_5921_length_1058_cov_1.529718_1_plen_274_part_10